MPQDTAEDLYLPERHDTAGELAPTAALAQAQYEIQGAIILARRFPRNEDAAYAKLMRSCTRPSFADAVEYSFPRGRKKNPQTGEWEDNFVTGPSVDLAREAARCWGNIRFGVDVVRDDDDSRQIRAWAWDLETNTKVSADDEFRKLIQRKVGKWPDQKTEWVAPDERDLRELTNRRAAMCVRNCLLQLMPKDWVEDAMAKAQETLKNRDAQDPDGARKRIILGFSQINITPQMLEGYLGHSLSTSSPAELASLRAIWKSIADGNSTWSEYAANAGGTISTEKTAAPPQAPPPAAEKPQSRPEPVAWPGEVEPAPRATPKPTSAAPGPEF